MNGPALAYAGQLGLAVFPVGRDCRQPLTTHGYKCASTDPDTIRSMWRRHLWANIAVATGSRSGVFVLDVDVHPGGADGLATLARLESHYGPLPATWRTITPGGGLHLWFRQPERRLRTRINFEPGLDVKAEGGAVAVPPSVRPDGAYRWAIGPFDGRLAGAPEWLLNLIDPPPAPRPPPRHVPTGDQDRTARYVASAINDECRKLAAMAPNSGRNSKLFQAAANLGELVGGGVAPENVVQAALEAAAHECGLVRDDGLSSVLATIRSGMARGIAQPRGVAA